MFSTQHYVAVAALIERQLDRDTYPAPIVVIQQVSLGLADIFEEDNERFDRERFLRACGITS